MQQRKIVEPILKAAYDLYLYVRDNEPAEMCNFLSRHDEHIPVWCDLDDATKQAAITYVYKQRKKIELHSNYCPAWVQATAYFMIWDWFYSFTHAGHNYAGISDGDEFDISQFFDDMDFLYVDNTNDSAVRAVLGIAPDFNEPF